MIYILYMELSNKKEHVIRGIKLGMDLTMSMYLAECTSAEMDLLNKDEDFLARVRTYQAIEEADLLERFDDAMDMSLAKGNTSAAQWKLERINKERWGKGGDKGKEGSGGVVIVLPSNGRD